MTQLGRDFYLNFYHADTYKHNSYKLPFKPHQILKVDEKKILLVEKDGENIAVWDKELLKITSHIADKESTFYGHCSIDYAKGLVLAPLKEKGSNLLRLYESASLKKIADINLSSSYLLHMSILSKNKKNILICISEANSSGILNLNLETKQISIKKFEHGKLEAGHIFRRRNNGFEVVGGFSDASSAKYLPIMQIDKSKNLIPVQSSRKTKIPYLFWLSTNQKTSTSCAINPAGNSVYLLSDSNKIISTKSFVNPIDVKSSKDKFMILSSEGIIFLDARTFHESKRLPFPGCERLDKNFHPLYLASV